MASHLDRIEAELLELAALLKEKCERPPPVPTKDTSVGRSTITRTPTPTPPAVPSVRSLSPPPERLPSPSSLITSMSWLSSHHSDDWDLMSIEDRLTSGPSSSGPSSTPTISALSTVPTPSTPAVLLAVVPPAPSDPTVRRTPSLSFVHLRDMLNGVLQQVADLRDGQRATHDMLREIRRETTEEPRDETSEQRRCKDMIRGIENMLQQILGRLASETSTVTDISDSRDQERLEDILRGHRQQARPPIIHTPTPRYPAAPLTDLLSDLGALPATGVPVHIEPLPTIHRPRTRARPRSVTPPVIFRPATAPVPSSDGEYRGVPPFIPPESTFTLEPTSILRSQRTEFEDVPPSGRPRRRTAVRRTSTGSPDMYQIIRRLRQGRRGDAADGVFIPAGQPAQPVSGPCLISG